jgi:4-amino-4-deoxy-L-arabinose transferase-like glycosyltransferase
VKNISSIFNFAYKYAPIFLISSFGALYILVTAGYLGYRPPVSPDESQALFFSKNLATKHTLIAHNSLNEQFSNKIFASRQYVQRGSETTPSAFLGYIFLLGFLQLFHHAFLFLAGPLLAIGCLIFIYKITEQLFTKSSAIYAIILTGTFPVFVYWTASYYNDLAEVFFILASLFYLIKITQNKSLYNYILLAISVSASIWTRYTGIILLPTSILFYAMINRKKIVLTKAIISISIVAILLTPLLFLNNRLYGSPFTYGQKSNNQLVYSAEDPSLPKEVIPFVPFRSASALFKNSSSYLIVFSPLLFIFGIIGALAAYKNLPDNRKYLLLLFTLCILWILYYMGGIYFGYGSEPSLNASYTRYLLLVYVILIIFFSYSINIINSAKLRFALLAASIVVGVNLTISGINSLKAQADSSSRWLTAVSQETPANSVLFVKGADKILYPSRNTALYLMLSKNTQHPTGINNTIKLMKEINDKGYPVYLFNEDNFYAGDPASTYISKLASYGLRVTSRNQELGFYRIGNK